MLSIEQRIALSNVLVYYLNMSAYRRRLIELRYVKSGSTSLKFQMLWYRKMKKSINDIVSLADNSFHDRIISCVYLDDPEIDIIEYSTRIGKKLAQALFFEGTIQEQLQDGSTFNVEVGYKNFVNLNTMRREVHRVILNMSVCRPMLLGHICRTQEQYQNLSIVNTITESEIENFADFLKRMA